jgi:hypothetical protein
MFRFDARDVDLVSANDNEEVSGCGEAHRDGSPCSDVGGCLGRIDRDA